MTRWTTWSANVMAFLFKPSVLFDRERWLYFATLKRRARNDNGLPIESEQWLRAAGRWP